MQRKKFGNKRGKKAAKMDEKRWANQDPQTWERAEIQKYRTTKEEQRLTRRYFD